MKGKMLSHNGGVGCDHCGTRYTEEEFEKLEQTGHNIIWNFVYRRCKECGEEITPLGNRRVMERCLK
jgi:hypothetical protein